MSNFEYTSESKFKSFQRIMGSEHPRDWMTHGSLSLDIGIMMLLFVAVDSCFMLLSVAMCCFFSQQFLFVAVSCNSILMYPII